MNNISFENSVINLAANTGLVYLTAYAGRSYIAINPAHAAVFACGTFIAASLGKKLAYSGKNPLRSSTTLTSRTIQFIGNNITPSLFIASKTLSPAQALTLVGLVNVCSQLYSTITKTSIWNLAVV